MRKITIKSCTFFHAFKNFKEGNTEVTIVKHDDGSLTARLYLFNNIIAILRQKPDGKHTLSICTSGETTNTTKERLNGLNGVDIIQKKGDWFLNGSLWDGSLINI